MSLQFPVAGLDHILGPLADGHIIALEGGGDGAASHLAALIATEARELGRPLDVVTTRRRLHPGGRRGRTWADMPVDLRGDLVIDAFSVLAMEAAADELSQRLMDLSDHAVQTGSVAILVLEDGMLDPLRRSLVRHFVDGVLHFEVQTDGVDVQRMLRIPRWLDGGGRDTAVYYQFDGSRLVVDTRRRHV